MGGWHPCLCHLKAITDDQIATAADTPEGNAFVQNMLAPRIKAGVEKVMAGQLNGTRSVRLDIVVKTFAMASAVQQILIGGGRGMIADANLVDARTGACIIANHDLRAVFLVGKGIVGTAVQAAIDSSSTQNVVEKLVDRYGESYRDWLLRRTYRPVPVTASPLQSGRGLCLKRREPAATRVPCRSVAQLVEHRSPKPGVAGSSPATPANISTDLQIGTVKFEPPVHSLVHSSGA